MKAIESYFRFPIRVFDPFSSRKARAAAENVLTDTPIHIPHAKGWASIPYSEARGLAYHDTYMQHRSIESVKEKGFDSTMVLCPSMGDYVCVWQLAKFEEMLSEYMDKMDTYIDKQREEEMLKMKALEEEED